MLLKDPLPYVEWEVAIIGQEVSVDVGELPHQQQGDAREGEKEKRPFLQGLEEATHTVVTERDWEWEKESEREEIKELGKMEADLVACPVAHYYPTVHYHERQESCSNHYVRPDNKQHCFHLTEWREHEKHHLFYSTKGQRHRRWSLLVPFFHVCCFPGLVQFQRHQCARAKSHPDDVGLAEEHGAASEECWGLVAAVESHEVSEEDEESRSRVCVVEKVEEVEYRKSGQGQSWQDSAWCCVCLKEKKKSKGMRHWKYTWRID